MTAGSSVVTGPNRGGGLDDLRRLSADGSVDFSFDPKFTGAGTGGWNDALTLDPEGKVLVSGLFTRVDGAPRGGIVRLNPDGSVDAAFDPDTGATDAFGATRGVASIQRSVQRGAVDSVS